MLQKGAFDPVAPAARQNWPKMHVTKIFGQKLASKERGEKEEPNSHCNRSPAFPLLLARQAGNRAGGPNQNMEETWS